MIERRRSGACGGWWAGLLLALCPLTGSAQPAVDGGRQARPGAASEPAVEEDLLGQAAGHDRTPLVRLLNSPSVPWEPAPGEDGRARFARYLAGVGHALEAWPALAREVAQPPERWPADLRDLLVWGYVVRAFHLALPHTLQELIALPTVAEGDAGAVSGPAWEAFSARLQELCRDWGLTLRKVGGGQVLEITPGGKAAGRGPRRVVILAVGDTPPTGDPAAWSHPPFAGEEAGRRIWGRGAVSKGGLTAALYALRALQDAGVSPGARPLLRIVRNGEAARRRGLAPAGTGRPAAEVRLLVGGRFPVGTGEVGELRLTVESPADQPGTLPVEGTPGFKLVELACAGPAGGRGAATGSCRVLLDPRDTPLRRALPTARRAVSQWAATHPGVAVQAEEAGGARYLQLTVGPAPAPLGATVLYLARELGVFPDARGRLVRFLADQVAGSPDGTALGLALSYPGFPSTSIEALTWSQPEDGGATAELRLRWPPGLDDKAALARVAAAAAAAGQAEGGELRVVGHGVSPHRLPDGDGTSRTLQAAYQEATGQEGGVYVGAAPSATKGLGLVPVFGPLPANEAWEPEGVEESLASADLLLAARAYAVAWLRLADESPPKKSR